MTSVGTGVELAANVKALLALTSIRQSAEYNNKLQQQHQQLQQQQSPVTPEQNKAPLVLLLAAQQQQLELQPVARLHKFAPPSTAETDRGWKREGFESKGGDLVGQRESLEGSNGVVSQSQQQATLSWYRKLTLPGEAGATNLTGGEAGSKQRQKAVTRAASNKGKGGEKQSNSERKSKNKSKNKGKRSSSFIGHASSNLVGKLMYMIKKSNTLTSEFGAATPVNAAAPSNATNATGQPAQVNCETNDTASKTKATLPATQAETETETATPIPAADVDGSLTLGRARGAGSGSATTASTNNRYRLSELGRRFIRRCKQSKAVQFATRNMRKKQAAAPRASASPAGSSGFGSVAANAAAPKQHASPKETTCGSGNGAVKSSNDKCLAGRTGEESFKCETGGAASRAAKGETVASVALQSATRTEHGLAAGGEVTNNTSVESQVFSLPARVNGHTNRQLPPPNGKPPLAPSSASTSTTAAGNRNGLKMNLATSLATVTNRFHCSASVGNLLSSYGSNNGGQQQRRELAELSGDSHLGGIKPLDYAPRGPFDQYEDEDQHHHHNQLNESSQGGSGSGGSSRGSSTNNIKDQAANSSSGKLGSQSCSKSQYLAVDNHSAGSASVSRKSSAKEKRNKQKDAERVEKLRLLVSYLKSGTSQPLLAPVTLDSEEIELAQKYKQHMILCEFCLQGAEQQLDQQQQQAVRSSASSGQLQVTANNHHDQQSSDNNTINNNHLTHNLTISHHLNDQSTNHHHHHLHYCNHLQHHQNQLSNHDQSSSAANQQQGDQEGLTMRAGPTVQHNSPPEVASTTTDDREPSAASNQGSSDEVDQTKTFLSSCRSVPQNLATWIDNEVNSLVNDLEAQSQLLVRNEKHAQSSSGGKRRWLSSSSSRRNSSGALST